MFSDVWAVVPVKSTVNAKQRLSAALPADLRRRLALAMIEDVLTALSAARGLKGIAVVTVDPAVSALSGRYGLRIIEDGALEGHTGAVAGAQRVFAREGQGAFVTMPGDIPLVTPSEIDQVVAARTQQRDLVIVPAHDRRGSNAVLCAPPDVMQLTFGDDSFAPHLERARGLGLEPKVLTLPGIGLDVDHPIDLAAFLRTPSHTRAYVVLQEAGFDKITFSPQAGQQ